MLITSKETDTHAAAFHTNTYSILITIGESGRHTDGKPVFPRIHDKEDICRYHQKQEKKVSTAQDDKERSKNVSATQQQDNYDQGNIEATS